MEEKKLLIVGIDPGITAGCAILDINGKLIRLFSSKDFNLNSLISESIGFGRVILVGTDKLKVPGLVHAFAAKVGADIISPDEDLKVHEKKSSTAAFLYDNDHQMDALASALFAYKSAKPLLDKIDYFAEQNKKESIRNRIKELVILKKTSIKNAVDIIEKSSEAEKIIEKVVFEKKISEKDFLNLYRKLKKHESELNLVKIYANKLKQMVFAMEKSKSETEKTDYSINHVHKDNRIRFLSSLIKLKDTEINGLKSEFRKLTGIFANLDEIYILKKLDTFGFNEFDFKNKILNIKPNDMLLVDNPNIMSHETIEALKNKVFIVVHKKPVSRKNESGMPFIFIDAKNLEIQDYGYFGVVEKKYLDAEKSKISWVKRIVEDYRKEKLVLR